MPNSIVFDCPASYSRNISEVRNLTCLKTLYLVGSIKIYRIIKPPHSQVRSINSVITHVIKH